MFDIGWSELAVIAVVALVVIGPKDLPKALKTVGIWVRKARAVSREFQGHVDQMIREAELEEMRQQVEKVSKINLEKEFEKTVDPTGSLAESIKPPVLDLPDFKSASEPPKPSTSEPTPAPGTPAPVISGTPASEPAKPAGESPVAPVVPAEKTGTNG